MSYYLELKDAVKSCCEDDRDVYMFLSDLLEDIKSVGINKYREELMNDLEENNRCKRCCSKLVVKSVKEDFSEYFEDAVVMYCEEC